MRSIIHSNCHVLFAILALSGCALREEGGDGARQTGRGPGTSAPALNAGSQAEGTLHAYVHDDLMQNESWTEYVLRTDDGRELKLDFKPKYVVVAHIDSTSSSIPKTVGYRVIGGLYNVEASKIDQVIWYETSTAEDEAAILAEMGTIGGKLYGLLFAQGEIAKKDGEAPAEEKKQ